MTVCLSLIFPFALVATWFASVPQATMLVAKPIYQRFAPGVVARRGSDAVWVANIVWTPVAGAAMSTAESHGWPHVFTLNLALWAFLGTPIAGASLATWALRVQITPERSRRAHTVARWGLVFWLASLFLAFRIPLEVPVECGFWWSTY